MPEYPLQLNEQEQARYRFMAERALRSEGDAWMAAGIVTGATVADVGCGPGAMSCVLAGLVGPDGHVFAVDQDPAAVEVARAAVQRSGVGNVTVRVGAADDTGLDLGSVDVAMIRHVLAHNGGREEAIVRHAAGLVRPGGAVHVTDIDGTAFRFRPPLPELDELNDRYRAWHEARGNDLSVGLRLDELLAAAGLDVTAYEGRFEIAEAPRGLRPPSWAAREALVAAGLADQDDVARWDAAFAELDARSSGVTMFAPLFWATGRRSPG